MIPHSSTLNNGSSTYIYIDESKKTIVSEAEPDDSFHTIEYIAFYGFEETDILRKVDTSAIPEAVRIDTKNKLKSSPLTYEVEFSNGKSSGSKWTSVTAGTNMSRAF